MTTRYGVRSYFGHNIYPAGRNSSGIRWTATVDCRALRADTLEGMRELIRHEIGRAS